MSSIDESYNRKTIFNYDEKDLTILHDPITIVGCVKACINYWIEYNGDSE